MGRLSKDNTRVLWNKMKVYINSVLNNISVTRKTLLYSNDATAGIEQQQITLMQMMNYDYLELVMKVSTTSDVFFIEKIPCKVGASVQATFLSSVSSPDIMPIVNIRTITIVDSTHIAVDSAYQKGTQSSTPTQVPTILLPYEIYGVKVREALF